MRSVFSALLWLAVAGSLAVYGVRLYRWATRRSQADDPAGEVPVPQAAAAASPIPSPSPAPPPAAVADSVPASAPPAAPGGPRSRPPVADALAGVTMPCDLSPIVQDESFVDPFRVVFVTDSASVSEVSAAVAGELVGLGFAVQPLPPNGLEANRDGAELSVAIHGGDDGPLAGFPTVRAGSVVVEFRT